MARDKLLLGMEEDLKKLRCVVVESLVSSAKDTDVSAAPTTAKKFLIFGRSKAKAKAKAAPPPSPIKKVGCGEDLCFDGIDPLQRA